MIYMYIVLYVCILQVNPYTCTCNCLCQIHVLYYMYLYCNVYPMYDLLPNSIFLKNVKILLLHVVESTMLILETIYCTVFEKILIKNPVLQVTFMNLNLVQN